MGPKLITLLLQKRVNINTICHGLTMRYLIKKMECVKSYKNCMDRIMQGCVQKFVQVRWGGKATLFEYKLYMYMIQQPPCVSQ